MSASNRSRTQLTIRDIALHAQVSVATVSRVLNGHGTVHPHLRDKVLSSLSTLDYQPSTLARSLRTRRTFTIGVIIPDILNPHFTRAVRGIQDTLAPVGYTPLLGNSDRDRGREFADVAALIARGVDGLILASSAQNAAEINGVVRGRTPIVLMDRDFPDSPLDSVSVDCLTPTRDAVLNLAQRGYRRIAHLAGPQDIPTAREKLVGFEEGLRLAGYNCDTSLLVYGDYTLEGGELAGGNLLSQIPHPDAIICANNLMTAGLLRAITSRGLSIPGDIAVVGTDDVEWTSLVRPPLTVIAQPVYELGQQAALLLLDRLNGEVGQPRRVRLEGSLIVRQST